MQDVYYNAETTAVIQLMGLERFYVITYVGVGWVKYRGHGHASALMREVLRDADKEGATLALHIEPGDDEGLSEKQLEEWYVRCGFYLSDEGFYIRYPRLHIVPKD